MTLPNTKLAYTVLVFLVFINVATATPKFSYNPAHWMADLKDVLYDQSLVAITLPGTHDSGAYEFSDTFSPLDSEVLDVLIKLCAELHIDIYSFIKNWSLTQDTTIYEQLMGGIRYVDLRACYIGDDWYTQHFLVGTRTQDLLNDINRFMTENQGEIVVVELGQLVPPEDEISLVKMLEATLGQWLAPAMDLNKTTIGEMVAKDQRIILLYPTTNLTQNYTCLWNKTIYIEGEYANMDKLADMEIWNVNEINRWGSDGSIFELSWTLTTQDSDIVRTLLDPFARTKTLKDFAIAADDALDTFAQQYHNYQLGNILLLDFWDISNVVNLTIDFNLRQCYDDPMFAAYDSNGLYCRNFFVKGYCTNPRYEDFMKEHCKLSCGVC